MGAFGEAGLPSSPPLRGVVKVVKMVKMVKMVEMGAGAHSVASHAEQPTAE